MLDNLGPSLALLVVATVFGFLVNAAIGVFFLVPPGAEAGEGGVTLGYGLIGALVGFLLALYMAFRAGRAAVVKTAAAVGVLTLILGAALLVTG